MESLDLSVIILTYNEQIHIRRCLENAKQFSAHIYVIDCFSTDKTVEIAEELGAQVFLHQWENNHAKQFNWALDNCPVTTSWVLRLDADEYLYPETIEEIRGLLPNLSGEVTSLSLPRAHVWMGRRLKRGTGKVILKRFFRFGKGRSELRLMDEHIVTTEGRDLLLKGAFADENLNNLSWWSQKHINYAVREAVNLLDQEYGLIRAAKHTGQLNSGVSRKRLQKQRYARLPLFWRAFCYFCYRYFLRGGFLEGREGFLWHFLQGFWYRVLVDAKVCEIKRVCGDDVEMMRRHIADEYHIALQ